MIVIKEVKSDAEPFSEYAQPLNEMATVCGKADGYDMIIEVYSQDHGVIGNKSNPAHAHVKNASGEYLGKFAITREPPSSSYYVFDCDKNKEIPTFYKGRISKWAKDPYKPLGGRITGWARLKDEWRALHPQN